MESLVTMRRPCFIEDDGLASIAAGMEPGFSGNNNNNNIYNHSNNYNYSHQNQNQNQNQNQPFSMQSTTMMMRRRNSLKNLSSLSSSLSSSSCPRSGRFYDARFEEPHFLEACFLCKKPLGDNRDIFMYRGDTPFCSEECRQEQIEIDEEKEKNLNLKSLRSKKESSKSASSSSSSSPSKNQKYPFRTGTVAAA